MLAYTFMGSLTCFARISLTLILTSQYLRHHVQIHFHLHTHIYTLYIFVEFWIFLYLKCSLLSLKWLLVFIVFPYFPRNTKTQGRGWVVVKIYKPPLPKQGWVLYYEHTYSYGPYLPCPASQQVNTKSDVLISQLLSSLWPDVGGVAGCQGQAGLRRSHFFPITYYIDTVVHSWPAGCSGANLT